jgi:predicted XRE-type DNA-binding protein
LQAQGLELIAGQLSRFKALKLVTVLRSAGAHELFVKFGVLVHGSSDRKKQVSK